MSRRAATSLLAALALLAPAAAARAQQDAITLTDGSATFHLENLRASPTGSNNGYCSYATGSPATNHMFQNWFWLYTSGDSRERTLTNQTYALESGNTAILEYDEPASNGNLPGGVRVTLQYTLTDLSTATGRSDDALLVIAWRVSNRTDSSININFYHYADFDAGGSAASDSAVVRGSDDHLQVITDAGGAGSLPVRVEYVSSAALHVGYEMGTYPAIRNKLTDASVLAGVNNAGAPFGPGDLSAMNEWGSAIFGPAGGGDTLIGSVAIRVSTRCKADYNESGSLGVNDIFAFLTDWFAGCP